MDSFGGGLNFMDQELKFLTNSFQKILVCIDGSDKSIEAAYYSISIAKKTKAQLVFLNVIGTEPVVVQRRKGI